MYIEINNISKRIKRKDVLKNISLQYEKGTVNGLIGSNGSGKTMLFRAICGLIKLDSGEVKVNGQIVRFNEKLPVSTGLILEHPGFLSNETAIENLKYLAELNNNYDEKYICYLLDKFGILENKDQKVKTFSLGMRQKLGIIQSIMERQELVILDEPTNGLDKRSVAQFIEIVQELKAQGKPF